MSELLTYFLRAYNSERGRGYTTFPILLLISLAPMLVALLPRRWWFWEKQRQALTEQTPEQQITTRILQIFAILAATSLLATVQDAILLHRPNDLITPTAALVLSLLLLRLNQKRPHWARYGIIVLITLACIATFSPEYLFTTGTILLALPMVVASLLLELRPMMAFASLLLTGYLVASYVLTGATGNNAYADYVVTIILMSLGFITFMSSQQKSRMIDERNRALQIQQRALRTLSHEIRTPLVALRGFFAMLETIPGTHLGPAEFLRASAREQVAYLNDVMERLVIYTRRGRVEPETVDLSEMARTVLDQMALPAQTAGVTLALDGAGTPALVTGDPGELRTVLVNLVDNALQHSGGSRVVITVNATSQRRKTLSVQDDGRGLSPNLDPHLLTQPFVQESNDPRGRWGFGFWMIAEITQRSGGQLTFGPGLDGKGLGVSITFKESVPMKQWLQRSKQRIQDALAPLAGLVIGLAFLQSWRRRRRRFQQEWSRARTTAAGEDAEIVSGSIDARAAAEISAAMAEEPYLSNFSTRQIQRNAERGWTYLVVDDDDDWIGFAQVLPLAGGWWWIASFYVKPDHRGTPVATDLSREICNRPGSLYFDTAHPGVIQKFAPMQGFSPARPADVPFSVFLVLNWKQFWLNPPDYLKSFLSSRGTLKMFVRKAERANRSGE
jgi:signal transduction histidine kinase/GNAT superfamily N-acetyltransferase